MEKARFGAYGKKAESRLSNESGDSRWHLAVHAVPVLVIHVPVDCFWLGLANAGAN